MRHRHGALAVVLLLTTSVAAEPERSGTEAVRQRLLAAYRSQTRIHHALRLTFTRRDREMGQLFAELFVAGDIGGLHLRWQGGGTDRSLLLATDGRVLAGPVDASRRFVMEGVVTLRAACAPYEALRQRWAERWGRSIPHASTWGIAVSLALDMEEVDFGLAVQSEAEPNWLEEDFLRGRRLVVDEAAGVARLVGPIVEGTIRLKDGLPIAWKRCPHGETAAASGGAVPPEWSEAEWRTAIREHCAGVGLEDLTMSFRAKLPQMTALLITAILCGDERIRASTDGVASAAELRRVLEEIAVVEVRENPPHVDTGETAAEYVERVLAPGTSWLRRAAHRQGWSREQLLYLNVNLARALIIQAARMGAATGYSDDSNQTDS